ncbi:MULTISPECIES: putative signal transducing protein [Pseudoalteromonas]|uniref:RanBP2-type domain-containing protein n=1 Tax=Pseudoalteromonas luteoviolacea H33 TaxID=1365251 RepID=A0A167FN71_9GAMM|nr:MULTISPECIES: DUF2007 domain-containing protein [Pseudoalteromonas]KZN52542.1 hypothetical protein N476_10790 [Pseudoalteromonas luteoviolacea H33]KZN76526.1 hypothetical protein N477_15565 [Pseudoalteromonas luteoviolacea H33-S]MDK1289249.1 DUF2007 domain-containing protein [Pseudoalteromonas sp. B95]
MIAKLTLSAMVNDLDKWCCVFSTDNMIEAHLVNGLLHQARIKTTMQGEALSSTLGELPFADNTIKIFVPAIKLPLGEEILVNYHQKKSKLDWQCQHCNELNGSAFEYCWHCGREYE